MVLNKTSVISSMVSIGCHLVFAMTAGAFLLNQEDPMETHEVTVNIIKKPPPKEREIIKEKTVQPQLEIVPIIQPQEIQRPKERQQPIQVAAVTPQVTQMPLQMERVEPVTHTPQAAMMPSKARRTLTAHASPKAMRSVPTVTSKATSSHVTRRTTRVQAYTQDAPAPKQMQVQQVPVTTGSKRTTRRQATVQAMNTHAPSPMAPVPVTIPKPKPAAPKPAPPAPVSKPVQVAKLPPKPPVVDVAPEKATDPGVLKSYIGNIQRRVARAKRYPSSARRSNHQGKVKVGFTLQKNGEVSNVHVVSASRYSRLNQAAMDAVKRAAPFDTFPEEVVEDSLDMVVPFSFTLR